MSSRKSGAPSSSGGASAEASSSRTPAQRSTQASSSASAPRPARSSPQPRARSSQSATPAAHARRSLSQPPPTDTLRRQMMRHSQAAAVAAGAAPTPARAVPATPSARMAARATPRSVVGDKSMDIMASARKTVAARRKSRVWGNGGWAGGREESPMDLLRKLVRAPYFRDTPRRGEIAGQRLHAPRLSTASSLRDSFVSDSTPATSAPGGRNSHSTAGPSNLSFGSSMLRPGKSVPGDITRDYSGAESDGSVDEVEASILSTSGTGVGRRASSSSRPGLFAEILAQRDPRRSSVGNQSNRSSLRGDFDGDASGLHRSAWELGAREAELERAIGLGSEAALDELSMKARQALFGSSSRMSGLSAGFDDVEEGEEEEALDMDEEDTSAVRRRAASEPANEQHSYSLDPYGDSMPSFMELEARAPRDTSRASDDMELDATRDMTGRIVRTDDDDAELDDSMRIASDVEQDSAEMERAAERSRSSERSAERSPERSASASRSLERSLSRSAEKSRSLSRSAEKSRDLSRSAEKSRERSADLSMGIDDSYGDAGDASIRSRSANRSAQREREPESSEEEEEEEEPPDDVDTDATIKGDRTAAQIALLKKRVAKRRKSRVSPYTGNEVPSLPASLVGSLFSSFAAPNAGGGAGMAGRKPIKVEKGAIGEVENASHDFFASFTQELAAQSARSGRSTLLTDKDVISVLKAQGHITPRVPLTSLVRKYLPKEFGDLITQSLPAPPPGAAADESMASSAGETSRGDTTVASSASEATPQPSRKRKAVSSTSRKGKGKR